MLGHQLPRPGTAPLPLPTPVRCQPGQEAQKQLQGSFHWTLAPSTLKKGYLTG